MYNQFVCLSGLPRSGSTLLSAILSQNPLIHAEGNSAVCQLMWDIQKTCCTTASEQLKANMRFQTVFDLISSVPRIYYKNITEKIVVDKCRSWTIEANYNLLSQFIDKNIKYDNDPFNRVLQYNWKEIYNILGIVPEFISTYNARKFAWPELVQENYINKVTFVYVLEEEHRRLGFSYSRPY